MPEWYKLLMFMRDKEVHEPRQRENGKWEIDLLIDDGDIKEFCEVVGGDYFCEGGVEVTLLDGYIGVNAYEYLHWLGMEHEDIITECTKIYQGE